MMGGGFCSDELVSMGHQILRTWQICWLYMENLPGTGIPCIYKQNTYHKQQQTE